MQEDKKFLESIGPPSFAPKIIHLKTKLMYTQQMCKRKQSVKSLVLMHFEFGEVLDMYQ